MEEEEKRPKSQVGEGRHFDPNFKGPIQDRGCTDILCCLLFIVALAGYLAVGIVDSDGNLCGQGSMVNKPFLFYFNILKCIGPQVLVEFQCPTTQICVEKCPEDSMHRADALRSNHMSYRKFCKEVEGEDTSGLPAELCPHYIIPMAPFTRRCLPDLSPNKRSEAMNNILGSNFAPPEDFLDASQQSNLVVQANFVAMRIFEDFAQSWHWIMVALLIATLISFIFVMLLRFLAGLMVWIMIVLVIAVIAYGIVHCSVEFNNLKGVKETGQTSDMGHGTNPGIYLDIRTTWLAFSMLRCAYNHPHCFNSPIHSFAVITLIVVEVFIIILLIYLRIRILVAIALIKEASRAVGQLTSTLLFPLLTFTLLSAVIAYWATTAVFLSTSSEQVYKYYCNETSSWQTCDPKITVTDHSCSACAFAFYGGETTFHKFLSVFQFYNLFLFFWCANFVLALGQVTLAGAFSSYYWAFNKPDDIPAYPIMSSLRIALRYHMGSMAFGSLILAVVQFIRFLLEYIEQRLQGAENRFTKFLLKCMKLCFWCLEKCIRFINRNAYIMVAIYGKNFCSAAKDSFFLLMRNFIRVVVLGGVTDYLLFLGKLLIIGIVGICSFYFFTGKMKYAEYAAPSLNYYWVPILTVVVGSYLISTGFFSVYAMCVDTLFLCFCEDMERNDGSAERPYYMSPELHEILSKTKRLPKRTEPAAKPDDVVVELEEGSNVQHQPDGMIQLRQQPALNQMNLAL
uniref:choline transporter-like protein 2 isoform X2 n=1 Tax=Doryrhamphus excisus TaxID=161450 RepID=UPI0025AE0B84|nr:choline transporter-like protein 2 isoform X2 [Doryrhamphus excisus]